MLSYMMQKLFYRSPSVEMDIEQEQYFENLLNHMRLYPHKPITATLRYPKHHFLHYLSHQLDVVFHGSNHIDIERFEPREQTLYNGQWTKSVFATTDPIWPMFYAVLDRAKVQGSFRNGCLVHKKKRYHFYSLNPSTMRSSPWTCGMLYILPKASFTMAGKGKLRFDEWVSSVPVKPIGRIQIHPEDFFFIDKISTHEDHESLAKTWLCYKKRTAGRSK
ncbi:hypothetical protein [Marinicrinis lubricantis]|uniref:Uncharacterized protein n=1 Tax=Marinicrinis lubricantis TaxID=2086470 RepID=A0ABW1IRR7_9BACL